MSGQGVDRPHPGGDVCKGASDVIYASYAHHDEEEEEPAAEALVFGSVVNLLRVLPLRIWLSGNWLLALLLVGLLIRLLLVGLLRRLLARLLVGLLRLLLIGLLVCLLLCLLHGLLVWLLRGLLRLLRGLRGLLTVLTRLGVGSVLGGS